MQFIGVWSPLTKVLLSIQSVYCKDYMSDRRRSMLRLLLWHSIKCCVSVGPSARIIMWCRLSLSVQTVHSVSAHPAAAARERPAEHLLIKVAHVIMAPPLCRVPPRWEEDRLCHQEIWASWLSWSWTTYMNKVCHDKKPILQTAMKIDLYP